MVTTRISPQLEGVIRNTQRRLSTLYGRQVSFIEASIMVSAYARGSGKTFVINLPTKRGRNKSVMDRFFI